MKVELENRKNERKERKRKTDRRRRNRAPVVTTVNIIPASSKQKVDKRHRKQSALHTSSPRLNHDEYTYSLTTA